MWVFSINPRRSVRRRNIVKSVLIELTGEFHSVEEAPHYLLCLMYTVLNNVSMRSIGMCARVRHVMIGEAIMVKGFLNRDWCLLDYRFCFKPFFLSPYFWYLTFLHRMVWPIWWWNTLKNTEAESNVWYAVSLQNFKKKCVGYNPNQNWSVCHLGVFNNRNTGHCWGPVCHFSVSGIECEMSVFIEYNT